MPVNKNGVGYSDRTPEKEDDFHYLTKLVAGKVKGYEIIKNTKLPFYYIDTHAGSGYNNEIGCLGSPLVALHAIQQAGLTNFQLILIDQNKKNCELLKDRLHGANITIKKGDCRQVLKELAPIIGGYGIMVVDPNGDPYFENLIEFFKFENTVKVDLCIRLSATSWKRVASAFERDDLYDCFGTNNTELKPAIKRGFINIETCEGECALNILNHTRNTPVDGYKAGQVPLAAFTRGI